jgi:hypothetical protein
VLKWVKPPPGVQEVETESESEGDDEADAPAPTLAGARTASQVAPGEYAI